MQADNVEIKVEDITPGKNLLIDLSRDKFN